MIKRYLGLAVDDNCTTLQFSQNSIFSGINFSLIFKLDLSALDEGWFSDSKLF